MEREVAIEGAGLEIKDCNTFIAISTPDIYRYGIGGKPYTLRNVEVVNGLDQADAAHLEQVVHLLTAT